jgi:hypothetical protein
MKIGALERNTFLYSHSFCIDDLRIWNKALTSSEVVSTISMPSTIPVNGLVVYYNFEQIENLNVGVTGVNDVRDQTGNTVHGDVYGGTILAGIETVSSNEISMHVYPNPASQQINLTLDLVEPGDIVIQIFDPLGKICFQLVEKVNSHYSSIINTSELTAGFYTITVKDKKSASHIKFMKS